MLAFALRRAIAVFLLLQAAFGSWRLAALAFLTLPVALVGGVRGRTDRRAPSSRSARCSGLLALLGIAVAHRPAAGPALPGPRDGRGRAPARSSCAAARASAWADPDHSGRRSRCSRCRSWSWARSPGLEIVHPMAVVLLGGLVTTTLLGLFVLPALYLRYGAGASRAAPTRSCRPLDERRAGGSEPALAGRRAGERRHSRQHASHAPDAFRTEMSPGVSGCCVAVAALSPPLALAGCTEVENESAAGYEPATLEAVDGQRGRQARDLHHGGRARGIGLETEAGAAGRRHRSCRMRADLRRRGETFVYTSPKPGAPSCARPSRSTASRAVACTCRRGRPRGTAVVTVGAAEVYGDRARDRGQPLTERGVSVMRWIVARSLRFRWLVLFAAAAMMAFGVAQIPSAQVDVFPEFAPPQVEIQTHRAGQLLRPRSRSSITVPIEEQLNGLPGLDELRSKSVSQLSSIQLDLRARAPTSCKARQLVQERLAQVTPNAADLGQPAVDDAAAVGDQPDHEDRALLGRS